MIILDIDADFFFYPTVFDDEDKDEALTKQVQIKSVAEVLSKFTFKDPTRYKIFNDHDSLYYDIRLNNYLVTNLIHIDAHSDLSFEAFFKERVSIGNFITPLLNEQIIRFMYWLYQDEVDDEAPLLMSNAVGMKFSEYDFNEPIDLAYFTISKEYCPANDLDIQFKDYMDSLKPLRKFQWSMK